MTERYTLEQHEAHVEAEEAKKAKEEEARRARMEKTSAKRAWVTDGGREADFEAAWPKMRDDARRGRIQSAERRAREGQKQHSQIYSSLQRR
ncbi:MAG: hypothetical protein H0T57_02020 [Rubrobacter sp.]|jgi:hypothetical protein|nr:hypothetical protein [Rubrobacter sp.]MBA3617842.1 hypothetical protein [Rubrobacteraceae bacterium]